jgi:putative transposase
VTLFLDAYSRLVMGWAISLYPSSATALTALRMGLVIDPERGPFGGVPTLLRWDNGLEFAATALTRAAAALGCVVSPTPPYTPHLKGKIERLHRTITQEFLNGLPFYTNGPRAADQTLYGPAADPITLDRFAGDFDTWVRRYNTTRPLAGWAGRPRWSAGVLIPPRSSRSPPTSCEGCCWPIRNALSARTASTSAAWSMWRRS